MFALVAARTLSPPSRFITWKHFSATRVHNWIIFLITYNFQRFIPLFFFLSENPTARIGMRHPQTTNCITMMYWCIVLYVQYIYILSLSIEGVFTINSLLGIFPENIKPVQRIYTFCVHVSVWILLYGCMQKRIWPLRNRTPAGYTTSSIAMFVAATHNTYTVHS